MKKLNPYLFAREDGFYTIDLPSDGCALDCVPLNPGTLRVENLFTDEVIYDISTDKK